jgi:hypothetical protein
MKSMGLNVVDEILQALVDDFPDDDAIRAQVREHREKTEGTAADIFRYAAQFLPDGPPPDDREVNPYAISLDPDRWEADGLLR